MQAHSVQDYEKNIFVMFVKRPTRIRGLFGQSAVFFECKKILYKFYTCFYFLFIVIRIIFEKGKYTKVGC